MSASIDQSQRPDFRLADISTLGEEAQLKYDATKGVHTESDKGYLRFWNIKGAALGFYARFISGSFSEANKQIAEAIRKDLGDTAAAAFKKDFRFRAILGQPITAGRVRSFVAALKNDETIFNTLNRNQKAFVQGGPEAAEAEFKKMTEDADKLFAKGEVKDAALPAISERYKKWDEETTGPDKTTTILTAEKKSTAEMEMFIDRLHQERLMPLACAQSFGADDRGKLLKQALHEPATQRNYLEGRLEQYNKSLKNYEDLEKKIAAGEILSREAYSELEKVASHLSKEIERFQDQIVNLESALKEDVSLNRKERTSTNTALKLIKAELEEAQTRYEALHPYIKVKNEIENILKSKPLNLSVLKELIQEHQQDLSQKLIALNGYKEWPPYRLAAVAKSDALIISKKISLQNQQASLRDKKNQLERLNEELKNAEKELEELKSLSEKTRSVDLAPLEERNSSLDETRLVSLNEVKEDAALFKKLPELESKISSLTQQIATQVKEEEACHTEFNQIQTTVRNLTDTATKAGWDQQSCQVLLNFVNKTDPEKIAFNRIGVKVNGTLLPLTDSQSYEENLQIFSKALRELALSRTPPLELSDDQIKEMLMLCSCEKTTQGTPSGAASAGDDLPSFGVGMPLIAGEKDCYEIVIPEDNPTFIDFQFQSARALLPKIQYQAGNEAVDESQLILLRHKSGETPDGFQQFERACSFTYRYTPKASETTEIISNLAHGDLELVKSQQAFWPLSLEDRVCYTVENKINAPGHFKKDSAKKNHDWLKDIYPGPTISQQFYEDLSSGSDKAGVYFLEEGPGKKSPPLYQKDPSDDSEEISAAEEKKIAVACQKFVDFVGNKDQALSISRYATQHLSPQLFISELSKAGAFNLPPHGNGEPWGKVSYSYTFSKSEKGEMIMKVHCDQKPTSFNQEKNTISLTDDSYLTLDYNITFQFADNFENGEPPPHLKVSDIKYDYSFKEELALENEGPLLTLKVDAEKAAQLKEKFFPHQ